MRLWRGLPLGLQIAIPIALFIGAAAALAIWHDNVHPASEQVARMARESIAENTGREVASVTCQRKVDVETGDRLPCHVVFVDGFQYRTVASITMRPGPGQRDYIDAKFSLPPIAVPASPAPAQTPSVPAGADADVSGLQKCLTDAASDPAKTQACVAGMGR
jgi:hypothetical protein